MTGTQVLGRSRFSARGSRPQTLCSGPPGSSLDEREWRPRISGDLRWISAFTREEPLPSRHPINWNRAEFLSDRTACAVLVRTQTSQP